jgi:hypothetical protein
MRIGVYLVGLNPAYAGGLTTYAIGLVNGLLRSDRDHKVILFVSDEARPLLAERINNGPRAVFVSVNAPPQSAVERLTGLPGLDAFHTQVRNRRMRSVSEQIAAECDLVLFPLCFMAAYQLRVPSIVSFHDLQH